MKILTRPIQQTDYDQWRPLWDGYNAFYGREGTNALAEHITSATWARFFSKEEPVHAAVAVLDGEVVGLVHYLFHRSTTRLNDVCYLQDLFTKPAVRGKGVGRQLITLVYENAKAANASRVYWTTHETNVPGRTLYDSLAEHKGMIVYAHELK